VCKYLNRFNRFVFQDYLVKNQSINFAFYQGTTQSRKFDPILKLMILNLILIHILFNTIKDRANQEYLENYSKETGLPINVLWSAAYIQMAATAGLLIGIWFPLLTKLSAVILLPNWFYIVWFYRDGKPTYWNYCLTVLAVTLHLVFA